MPEDSIAEEEAPARAKAIPTWILGVASGAVLCLIVALSALLFFGKSLNYTTQITPQPDGASLAIVFNFPDAPAGAAVEFSGKRSPVVNGTARFDFPIEQLGLGDNRLKAVYSADGKTTPLELTIARRHKITLDLAGLGSSPPFFETVFMLAKGESLTVGNQLAALDGQNTYRYKMALSDALTVSEQKDNQLVVHVPFQLKNAQGSVDSGDYLAKLPLTDLRIDRPAADAVVDSPSVVCSGETEEGAVVTVNGDRTAVTAGRFETKVALPKSGETAIEVTSKSAGKAPRRETLRVKRVENLEAEALKYAAGVDGTIDYPTLGRNPDGLVGRKVKMSGRIVNIKTELGVTVFLLYVSAGCPKESRCGLYGVFKGESQAGLYSWVTVYGEVRGKRDVQIKDGESIQVPAVEAAFLIPEKPTSRKSKPKKR